MVECPNCGQESHFAGSPTCDQCGALLPAAAVKQPVRTSTLVEAQRVSPPVVPRTPTMVQTPTAASQAKAVRHVPQGRPPLALLCVLDDGLNTGEWIRLRTSKVVIGRSEGDIQICHDTALSARHLELSRVSTGGRSGWRLRDLNSSNGTFVRATRAVLKDKQEIMLGISRLRFATLQAAVANHDAGAASLGATQPWRTVGAAQAAETCASLEVIAADGTTEVTRLTDNEYLLGTESGAARIALSGDSFVDHSHARLFKDQLGKWNVEDRQSVNGTWLRVQDILLDSQAEFFAGEQRFILRMTSHANSPAR